MKHTIFILLLFSFSEITFPQQISVEISIEWKSEINNLNIACIESERVLSVPYLTIAYRNNTEDSIYFSKIIKGDFANYPPVGTASLMNTTMDLADRVNKTLNFTGKQYQVNILGQFLCSGWWDVVPDSEKNLETHPLSAIGEELHEIYECIKTQEKLNRIGSKYKLSCFNYKDKETISYEEAWEKVRDMDCYCGPYYEDETGDTNSIIKLHPDNFVFLKKGDSYCEQYNLIGFLITGGEFNFSLNDNYLFDYVEGHPVYNENTKKSVVKKIKLPKQVNGYILYSGNINTNSVGLKIVRPGR